MPENCAAPLNSHMFHKVMALSTLVLQCWFFKKIKMLTLVLVHFELGSCSDFIPTEDPKPKLGNLSVTNWGRNSLHLQRLVWLVPSSNQSKWCAPDGINAEMDVVP